MRQLKKLWTRKNWWLAVLLALELLFLGGRLAADWGAGSAIHVTPDLIIPYADKAVNDSRGCQVENYTGQFATTRWLDLEPGSYQVVVHYVNNGKAGSVKFLDEIMPTARYDLATLQPGQTSVSFSLWMDYGCDTAQMQFYSDCGEGEVTFITEVQIVPTHSFAYVHFLTALAFFALADFIILLATKRLPCPLPTVRARYSAAAIAGIVALACLPLGLDYLTYGHDLTVHLSRIEGLKAGLLAGQFPVRMDPDLLAGRGYPFSLMYADLLLYPAALLRILGFSLQTVYKLYVAAVTLATALLTRYVLRRMLKSESLALVGTALYVLSFYRLTNVFVRASVGEYSAMLFLPLVVYGLWRIYTQPLDGGKGQPWCWAALAIGFTGLLQTHLLTTMMAGVLCFVFCLAAARRTFRKPVFLSLCKAAAAALGWNLWFLVPLLQYMLTGACFISGRYNALSLYNSAAWPAQMFTMFGGGEMDAGSGLGYANPLINGMTGEMPLSLGTVLGLGAGLFLLALLDPAVRGADRGGLRLGGWALGFGALCVYLASDLFPWYALSLRQDPLSQALSSLLGKLQYVWRFLAPATVLLVLATCCGLLLYKAKRPDWARLAGAAALLLTVIPAGYLLYETCTTSPVLNYMSLGSFGIKEDQVAGGEYMPYDLPDDGTTDYDGLELSAPEGVAAADVVRGALSVQFTAENTTGSEATVLLPLYAYPGYALTETGSGAVLGRQQGYLAVTLPAGYSGTVTVQFAGFWFWRAADLVSLACILACTGVYIRRRRAAVAPSK